MTKNHHQTNKTLNHHINHVYNMLNIYWSGLRWPIIYDQMLYQVLIAITCITHRLHHTRGAIT